MRARFLIRSIAVAALAASAGGAQQAPTLPAAFYDVEVTEQLGFGAPRIPSRGGVFIGVRSRTARTASQNSANTFAFGETRGAARFIIDADSLLFRDGPDYAEIAIRDFISVDEVHRPAANVAAWVRITYRARGETRELFVRRTGTERQDGLLAALRLAMAVNRERAEASR
jgi:hypothetical protein